MEKRKFIIECEIPERWVNDFCSFLKYIESNGKAGHSSLVGFYADGDGDFRPEFNINTQYERTSGKESSWPPEVVFDAG